ncbi:MAG: hypothetical protein ACLFN5_03580 [bacterium]
MIKDRSILNIIVYPEIQKKLLLTVIITGLIVATIFGAFIYMQTNLLLRLSEETGHSEIIRAVLIEYGAVSFVCFVMAMLLMSLFVLLISHRLVGPLKRLMHQVDQMYENQKIDKLIIRDTDHLRPFFDKLNRLLENAAWKEK